MSTTQPGEQIQAPDPARAAPWKKLLSGWQLKAFVSLGLVAVLAANLDWVRVVASLATADKADIAIAFVLLSLAPPMTAERWRCVALASGIALTRTFWLRATYAAVFVGQFLPAGVGVDVARLGILWKAKVALRPAVQSVAIDRIVGVASIIALMLVGMPFAIHLLPAAAIAPTVLAAVLLVGAFTTALFLDRLPFPDWLVPRAVRKLLSILPPARAAMKSPRVLLALAYGIALHALSILAVLLLARAFGYTLPFQGLLTVVSFTIFAALLPISFNGWGVRESGMVIALSLLSVSREAALMVSFLLGIGSALASLPGSLAWMGMRRSGD